MVMKSKIKMGIRAIGFQTLNEIKGDPAAYINSFKEALIDKGAFGYENWRCRIQHATDLDVRIISFTDSPNEMIVVKDPILLVTEASFSNILRDIGLNKKTNPYKIEGGMIQLGDFKIRYGIATAKEKPYGVLFDIEYLPTILLSVDYTALFASVCNIMKLTINLSVPAVEGSGAKYSYTHLGQHYLKIIKEFLPSS